MARPWGFWTKYKLDLLERYLDRFTTASQRSTKRVYLDLFGGEPDNYERGTNEPIEGSARIALRTDNPPFTHLRFFELPSNAKKLSAAIDAEFPGRDARVYVGDCNETIHDALADLHKADAAWAPTFAFIDPNGPHFSWRLLQALAKHKPERSKTKVELWMLFPDPLFVRLLPSTDERAIRVADEAAISTMFGTRDWHAIYDARLTDLITPAQARDEYVNLMRWRLEQMLGYRWTHELLITTETVPIYHMIFATDSDAGNKIMGHLHDLAVEEFPAMAAESRRRKATAAKEAEGQYSLFEAFGIEEPAVAPSGATGLYVHEPPSEPRDHDPETCTHCGAPGASATAASQ